MNAEKNIKMRQIDNTISKFDAVPQFNNGEILEQLKHSSMKIQEVASNVAIIEEREK